MKKPHKKINVEIKEKEANEWIDQRIYTCLLYTSPSPRDS